MNNCRIPNFPGATMRFVSVYIDIDARADDTDDDDEEWEKQKHCMDLAICWRAEEELMTFDYDEEDYYEHPCY